MKLTTFIALGIAAVSFTAVTQAATINSYLTGSTAYRAATATAILNYAAGVADGGSVQFGYTGASYGGANQAIVTWTQGGGTDTYFVFTNWTGSEGGLQTVGNPVATTAFLTNAPGNYSAGGTANLAPGANAVHPDAAMSDTFQNSSQFNGTFQGITYSMLTEATGTAGGLGIVPFKWCTQNGSALTAVTSQQLRALYSNGKLPLAVFTGNNADENKVVLAIGRDPDSGTRLTAFADIGLGGTATVTQFQPTNAGNAQVTTTTDTITKFVKTPAGNINGTPVGAGNNGYNSGGNFSKAIAAILQPLGSGGITITPAGTHGNPYDPSLISMVAYLGTSDADTNLLNAGNPRQGIELSFNGNTLGNVGGNYATVQALTEGKYSYWGYEHMYYNNGTIAATTKTVCDGIASQLFNTDATVKVSAMRVSRSTDGSFISNGIIYGAP